MFSKPLKIKRFAIQKKLRTAYLNCTNTEILCVFIFSEGNSGMIKIRRPRPRLPKMSILNTQSAVDRCSVKFFRITVKITRQRVRSCIFDLLSGHFTSRSNHLIFLIQNFYLYLLIQGIRIQRCQYCGPGNISCYISFCIFCKIRRDNDIVNIGNRRSIKTNMALDTGIIKKVEIR